MGSCFSKKNTTSSSPCPLPDPPAQIHSKPDPEIKKPQQESLKNETLIINHRKSHEINRPSEEENPKEQLTQIASPEINTSSNNGGLGNGNGVVVATPVRTSSCTKEEVDAILIQCGRLSRSSSTGKPTLSSGSCENASSLQRGRKYSGSKRSYDFDNEVGGDKDSNEIVVNGDGDEGVADRVHRHRQRHRDSRVANSSPHGRRRTPSRERDPQQQQQRSGSRERGGNGGSGGGRRVSRSPGRRSESPITNSNGVSGSTSLSGNANCRPGKLISVPAMAMDKSYNGGGGVEEAPSAAAIKRVQVKRNVGAASPRNRSPARTSVKSSTENQNAHGHPNQQQQQQQQQPLSLSRSNSRKAEQSPYRRNPLSEIDNNVTGCRQPALPVNKSVNNNTLQQGATHKPSSENVNNSKVQGADNKGSNNKGTKEQQPVAGNVAMTVIPSGTETFNPQSLTRSRSSRLSRDLDINPETLLDPNPSYNSLLLKDIHNFHQKTTPAPAFSLPACLTKANSILDAVADLNSGTSSNSSLLKNATGKKTSNTKDPVVESEVVVSNDLMEPSFHKYVTVRRGATGEEGDMEEQESSGSNSFVGGPQHWLSSSSWEPNSADSTDCYSSSRTNTRENELNPLGIQRHALSESCRNMDNGPHRRLNEKTGIGRGRVGTGRGLYSMTVAAAAST